MATWDDVDSAATDFPEVSLRSGRGGTRIWSVRDKHFVWERPLRKADFAALGDAAPDGPILGVSVPDLTTKDVLIAARPQVFFTTPHFDGYKAILVRLDAIEVAELGQLFEDAWLARAPKSVAKAYRQTHGLD